MTISDADDRHNHPQPQPSTQRTHPSLMPPPPPAHMRARHVHSLVLMRAPFLSCCCGLRNTTVSFRRPHLQHAEYAHNLLQFP